MVPVYYVRMGLKMTGLSGNFFPRNPVFFTCILDCISPPFSHDPLQEDSPLDS